MDVLQNLIFITSSYIYFKLMLILISNKWWLLKAAFSWNHHVSCKILWIYSKILWIYSDNLRKLLIKFFTYLGQTKVYFQRVLSLSNILINEHYVKNAKYRVRSKLLHVAIQIYVSLFCNETATRKVSLRIPVHIHKIFHTLEINMLLWRFGIILRIWSVHLFLH